MAHEEKSLDILVIDDDEFVRMILARIIHIEGDNTTQAENGQDGIDEFVRRYNSGYPNDIVITDLNMGDVSGADVTRAVKELSPTTPVYIVTAYEANEVYKELKNQLGELQPDAVLDKPLNFQDIRNILTQVRLQKYGPENASGYQQQNPQL